MPTTESVRYQYATALDGPPPDAPDPTVTLLPSKYAAGGEPAVNAPLSFALLERHDGDMHFAVYSGPREVRCRKDLPHHDLTFSVAAFDLDYAGHRARPDADDLTDLLRLCWVLDETPNAVYPTRGGARLVYAIDPITDADEFEAHFHALLTRLAERTAHSPYHLDQAAKDWTRLFRAPRVVRDGTACWDTPVYWFHDAPFDLRALRAAPKPKRAPRPGGQKFAAGDPYIAASLRHVAEGNRNRSLFRLLCHTFGRYAPDAAEKWVETLRERFADAGMDDREFEATLKSARRTAGT